MKGPWLPLYGSGAIIILIATMPFAQYPVAVYFAGAVAATILEYFTGVAMVRLFKVRYWDYSYRKIQFQGHICLVSTIAWGFLGLLMVYVVHKPVAAFISTWNPEFLSIFTFVVTICMVYDFANAFRDAMDLRALLTRAEELAGQLNTVLEEEKEELVRKAAEKRYELEASVNEKKEQLERAVSVRKEELEQYAGIKREEMEAVVTRTREQFEQYKEEKRSQFERAVEEYQEIRELNKFERNENIANQIAAIEAAREQLRMKIEKRARHLLLHNPGSSFKGFEEESKAMRRHLQERRRTDEHR